MVESTVRYIESEALKSLILDKKTNFLIVDVREDDYQGGKIKGSIHIPAYKFEQEAPSLLKTVTSLKKDTVIFHCYYSQVRGPRCAYKFARIAKSNKLNIFILEGGWARWQNEYESDTRLVEMN